MPETVEIIAGEDRIPMHRGDDGWWTPDRELALGTDYAFLLDGSWPALPDPRSAWQPDGVDGPSRIVDHAAFRWSDEQFRAVPLASAVFYELHVGTFSSAGTFAGVVGHLQHLVGLGVTHVELMPVNEFSGDRGWGYDGVDLFAPHHAYGGPDGLKQLVDACHASGLAVVLDVVYNHLGPAGNYLERFGPYFTPAHASPWGSAVNFDAAGSDEVRRFFIDNALMWLRDYHLDGLRLDAVHALADTSAIHILEEIAAEVRALSEASGRPLVLIAESDLNDPRLVQSPEAGGYGLDAQWSDDFHHALHAMVTGERTGYYEDFGGVGPVAKALRDAYVYDGAFSPHRGRRHGRPATGVPRDRFLGFVQNHDQVGNRAGGDRLSGLTSRARARVAAALVLTGPFVPMLFMGEEWAASTPFLYFTDHRDPGLGEAVRTGRRNEFRAFGWDPDAIPDPQDPATFERSRLPWDEVDAGEHASMLSWYRALIAFRRSSPSLSDPRPGIVEADADEEAGTIVVRRGSVMIVANVGAAEASVCVPVPSVVALASVGPGSDGGVGLSVGSDGSVRLPPDSVAVLTGAVDGDAVGRSGVRRPEQE
jgi:maltooligosyltrehalose trehalohydrolase